MVKRSELEDMVRLINRKFNKEHPKFELDYLCGSPRLQLCHNGRYLSPRYTNLKMKIWLDGFAEAIDHMQLDKNNEVI